jgi:hypothetical protein
MQFQKDSHTGLFASTALAHLGRIASHMVRCQATWRERAPARHQGGAYGCGH